MHQQLFVFAPMDPTLITSGSLFTRDYLAEAIAEAPEWGEIDVADLRADGA